MDMIKDVRKKRGIPLNMLPWIYENTTCGSPLCRIYVHQSAWHLKGASYRRTGISLPKEFLTDLAVYLRDINIQKLEFSRKIEDFYVKEDGEGKE
jgi:hypothetical protein